MRSFLTVTTPAGDLGLLSIEELRAAAGVADDSQDTTLTALGLSVAASIMSECNIAVGAGGQPTLWQETLTETFYQPCRPEILLARRYEVVVASATLDDVALGADEYLVNPEAGMLSRLSGGCLTEWYGTKLVVVYQAGFATIPADLKQAATDFFRSVWKERGRDPLVKAEQTDIPGVRLKRTEYWVGSVPGQSNEGPVPDIVSGQLKRFRNMAVG